MTADPDPDEMNADPQPWFCGTIKSSSVLQQHGVTEKISGLGRNRHISFSTSFYITFIATTLKTKEKIYSLKNLLSSLGAKC